MNDSSQPENNLDNLLECLIEGTLDDAGMKHLQTLLKQDKSARLRYLEYLELHGELLWEYSIETELNPLLKKPKGKWHISYIWGRVAMIAICITAILAIGVKLAFYNHNFPPYVSALISPQWADSSIKLAKNDVVPLGTSIQLNSGVIELNINSKNRVQIQGPASFKIESKNNLFLESGKLAAHIEDGKFSVKTNKFTVDDLGTEFAINLGGPAPVVEVFKGRVNVVPNQAAGQSWNQIELTAGAIALVSDSKITIDPSGASPQRYVRTVSNTPLRLDVVDLLSGGDGRSNRKGFAIDPRTGVAGLLVPENNILTGDNQFHVVTSIPAIDGCFIPDGRRGPTKCDSAGHTWQFPATSGSTYSYIWAGGSQPGIDNVRGTAINSVLNGVDYASEGHSPLYLHANKGVTLNLDAIRRLHPGHNLVKFDSVIGNTFSQTIPDKNLPPKADFFVLVDGQMRFQKRSFLHSEGPMNVNINISDNDHYLTLVATDGSDQIYDDWIVCGDPKITTKPFSSSK